MTPQSCVNGREILKVNKQRAQEGELAKSIESLEEVRSARVHLALP